MNTVIDIDNGGVALGGRPILRGINLTVHAGEVVGVLGANGSGKSTLVRASMGLVPTSRGEVRLFDTPLAHFRAWKRIGFVPQRVSASSGVPASVWEVVAAGRLGHRRLFRPMRSADRTAIDDAIGSVGLSPKSRDGVSTLSGGQQQRVLIARALATEPDLLVLDEPTAGVDLASQQAFADALTGLVACGATIVLVAHELGALEPLIGRTVVMRDGRIWYDGPLSGVPQTQVEHHHPELTRPHSDYTPGVVSPLDLPGTRGART